MSATAAAPQRESDAWPADAGAIHAARTFLQQTRNGTAALACDSDVDGLASAVLLSRAVEGLGGTPHVLAARRGEHVHAPAMRDRIAAMNPGCLVVADMGSRPAAILPLLPTLIVDHHDGSAGLPPGAVVVNGYDRPPVATSSVLAWIVARGIPGVDASAWLAALGAVADLGSAAPFAGLIGIRAGGDRWRRAASLLNAARRAPQPDPDIALAVLRRARTVADVTSGVLPETRTLERFRDEVRRELDRCSRTAPVIASDAALLRFSSPAQVHPLVATRWSRRLRPRVVIAANDGYLPGRTNFAVRSEGSVDLLAWLRSLPFTPPAGAEFAHGHARATGGSLPHREFEALLRVLGFTASAGRGRERR